MKKVLFLVVFLFGIQLAPAFAQQRPSQSNSSQSNSSQPTQTVRGTVIDAASQAPIAFASVVLLNTDPLIGTTTDIEGSFILKNVPTGRYDVKVSYVGYEPAITKEVTVSSSKETTLQIRLQESVSTMDGVLVRPSINKEQPLNAMATVSARMLSVEEAQRYAGGFDDPARLASSFAGVASSIGNNGIIIRGNAPKALQWKLEGVEIPNPNHFADIDAFGGGGVTALSSQMLANSDFLTGAFAAEYSNATSGVFDIFMRTGNNVNREHTFQLGAIGIDFSSEGPFTSAKRSSYLFNYRFATLSLLAPLLPDDAQGTKYQDLSFKMSFPTKNAGVFSFWGIGLADKSGQLAENDSTKWITIQDKGASDVNQYMAASGLSHIYFFNKNTSIRTTLAGTVSGLGWDENLLNNQLDLYNASSIDAQNWNFVFTSAINKKFSVRHTNKTGFTLTGLKYDMNLEAGGTTNLSPSTLVDESGFSTLISAYSSSAVNLTNNFSLIFGLNGQIFTLNNHFTVEPRVGLKWQFSDRQNIAFAYGLHSRLEKINYFFATSEATGDELINKDMDFSKAHHLVASYGISLSENMSLKIEPYFQQLFNVPVIADSSFSFINLKNDWFVNHKLENTGEGRNYGIDFTLEKYLSDGYYYMVTASVFNSEFLAGDNAWRSTLFNRNYLINILAGREWHLGKNDQNLLGLNARLTYQGGDRYTPADLTASQAAQEVVFNENKAFSLQTDPSLVLHLTASLKINKQHSSHEIAIKILNTTGHKEYLGHQFNFVNNDVEERRELILIPNISYKIEF